VWISDAPRRARVLPDGCMDLIEMDDRVLVAGPDTTAFISEHDCAVARGIRFRPGVLRDCWEFRPSRCGTTGSTWSCCAPMPVAAR
ncbi:DUF6597 domain-containing transcriptional factor, partial [Mycobacterium sp.]|uniref:DUF6597 domain-containing transcriptional factor n=1 Tax=Mycobacterium sp. TaxID=1785 RepID=UPI003C70CC39